jgi:hypothetical protein
VQDRPAARISAPAPEGWFHAQRAGAHGAAGARGARALAVESARARGLSDAPGVWVAGGPRNVGGRVTALGVDPNDRARIWVGTAAGGVFLTEDEGVTFRPVFDGQVALSVGSLAVHPTISDIVYVGTGEDNGAGYVYDGDGVFKTTDGGETWTNVGLSEVRRIGRLAIDPTNGERIFAAAGGDWYVPGSHRGIYRSVDGGGSWQQVLFVANDAGGIDIAIDPANPSRVYAAIWQRSSEGTHWHIGGPASGIYRSLDGGDTWSELTSGLPTVDMGKIGLAIAPTDPRVIYANIINPAGTLQGIYRSLDGGDTWVKRSNNAAADWYGDFGYYFAGIVVDPHDANTTYALDVRLLRSTNGGRSVGPAEGTAHVDWHDLIIDASRRWLGATDGGLYISQDDGSSWAHAGDLPITQFYDLGIDGLDARRRFGGSQDNGTLRTLTAGTNDWAEVLADDGLQCEVDPTNSSKVYASKQAGGLHRSVDGGATFTAAMAGIDTSERVNWNAPLTLDPSLPSTIYTGRTRVYRSTDSMLSWSPISPDLSAAAAAAGGADPPAGRAHAFGPLRDTVTALAVSPVNRDVLWAGTDSGRVWVSGDGGAAWTRVDPPGPSYWVTEIAADRVEANTAYLAVTGYRQGDGLPYVRVTRDLGASWSDVTGNLPPAPVNAIVTDPDWRGRLFAGTDLGVYVSDDEGGSWSDMRGGMPHVVVLDLVRHDPGDTLFAATHGRSVYTFDLAQLGPADGDGDGIDNNVDCALADAGAFAAPGEVVALSVDRRDGATSALTWTSLAAAAGTGTRYDLARGDIAVLTASGGSWGSVSFDCGVTGASSADASAPATGSGFYYLVRGRNACGVGSWGADSGGSPRASSACP